MADFRVFSVPLGCSHYRSRTLFVTISTDSLLTSLQFGGVKITYASWRDWFTPFQHQDCSLAPMHFPLAFLISDSYLICSEGMLWLTGSISSIERVLPMKTVHHEICRLSNLSLQHQSVCCDEVAAETSETNISELGEMKPKPSIARSTLVVGEIMFFVILVDRSFRYRQSNVLKRIIRGKTGLMQWGAGHNMPNMLVEKLIRYDTVYMALNCKWLGVLPTCFIPGAEL